MKAWIAAQLFLLLALPALAAPAALSGISYDEPRRTITVGLTQAVSVRTQRVKNPDRLVIDLSEARLPQGAPPLLHVRSPRIRAIRIGQNSYVPAVVRVVVDLMPGFEPMVKVNQPGGKLMITLADPTPPQGERDLESLPAAAQPEPRTKPARPLIPDAPLPQVVKPPSGTDSQAARPAVATPRPVAAAPRPVWTPPPVPGWVPKTVPTPTPLPMPVETPSEPSRPQPTEAPLVLIPEDVRPAEPAPTLTPTAQPTEPPAVPEPEPAVTGKPQAPVSIVPSEWMRSGGFGSTFQLRWQQIETLEEYGGPDPSFAYPAGVNGFDLEHWFLPNVGAGMDARVLIYDLTVESVRQHRTDATLGSYLALRYPLGFLEPSLRAGYMGRNVTVESESTGASFPFSPVQTYYGPTLSGRLRVNLAEGFGLDLHGRLMPNVQGALFPGFQTIFPLSGRGWGASFVMDIWRGHVSFGYATEQAGNADNTFRQTFGGLTLGAGLRY